MSQEELQRVNAGIFTFAKNSNIIKGCKIFLGIFPDFSGSNTELSHSRNSFISPFYIAEFVTKPMPHSNKYFEYFCCFLL